jgi:alpha-D-ribose 1-methylphosphonate 5-triphosphate diphosphatase
MDCFTVTNAVVVLPNELLDRATVRIERGRIAEIEPGPVSSSTEQETVFDADGAYLIPGVVDIHNDNLEFEINPRPRANLPLNFALSAMERRLVAAGVTTEFHAISFMDRPNKDRSIIDAEAKTAFIAALQDEPVGAVRHHILHRLEARQPEAFEPALNSIRNVRLRYVSLNDHTPGQGQYRDVAKLVELAHEAADRRNAEKTDMSWYVARMEKAMADMETVPAFYQRLAFETRSTPMVISTHDDDTIEKVEAQHAIGATVAEFPITMEAAQRARDHRMTIVVGAPNILRGGSQSGNLAAAELVRAGLADAICADYHAPCLIPAAFRLVNEGLLDLPAAMKMITQTPANAVGLADLGAILPNSIADLALVRVSRDGLPEVEAAWTGGRQSFVFPRHQYRDAERVRVFASAGRNERREEIAR